MTLFQRKIFNTLTLSAAFLMTGCATNGLAQESNTVVTVDWTYSTGKANRNLFSIQGYPQVVEIGDPDVEKAYLRLNPSGTQQRLEHWIHFMEPENDNNDPFTFDWDNIQVNRMIRFSETSEQLIERIHELGMEPLVLLGYTANWLNTTDGGNTVDNYDEWAEFTSAVATVYMDSERGAKTSDYQKAHYFQLWNEPNFHFWEGTDEQFFDLYNTAAKRLNEEYPSLMIGGPTSTNATAYHDKDPVDYMSKFLENCGMYTDYLIFHHYGPEAEGTEALFDYFDTYLALFKEMTENPNGKIMMTELDAWYSGPSKARHLMDRQFGFIDRQHDIIAIHQFCLLAYNESGNHTFGVIDQAGGILPSVYWPYWMFRNWIGDTSYSVVQTNDGSQSPLRVTATNHQNEAGQNLSTAVFYNTSTSEAVNFDIQLFAEESTRDSIISMDKLNLEKLQPESMFGKWNKDQKKVAMQNQTLAPGEVMTLTLRDEGKSHFTFADVNNQETPWLFVSSESENISFRESVSMTAEITNTTFESINGKLNVVGLPDGWTATFDQPEATSIQGLEFGQTHQATFTVSANTIFPDLLVPVMIDLDAGEKSTRSLAHTLRFAKPIEKHSTPEVVMAARGERNQVGLQMRNLSEGKISGMITPVWDDASGITSTNESQLFEVTPGETERYYFDFTTASNVQPGTRTGNFQIEFLGTTATHPFVVDIVEDTAMDDSNYTMVDLSSYFNYDPVAFAEDRDDVSDTMGMFSFPADHLPSDQVAKAYGIPHKFASLKDGNDVSVLPQNQKIEVEDGNYDKAYFLGFGHDGKHPCEFILHFADGSKEIIKSEIPEWCTPPPAGARRAFTAPHRYLPAGISEPPCELWQWPVNVDESKELAAIEMPSFERAAHIFSITLRQSR